MQTLLSNEQRLSVEKYQEQFNCTLPNALRMQYLVPNVLLNNMLLSPRAVLNVSESKNGETEN